MKGSVSHALDIYARSTAQAAAAAAGVSAATVHRWADTHGVACGHTVAYRPGLAGYVDGCRCDECTSAANPVHDAAVAYVSGEKTLRDIAADLGVSFERVRQLLDLYIGGRDKSGPRRVGRSGSAVAARRAVQHEREVLIAEITDQERKVRAEREGVTCSTCGRPHHRERAGGWALSCSPECREMWAEVRYLTPEHHELQVQRIESWALRNPDRATPSLVQLARRRAAGDGPTHDSGAWASRTRTRWLIPGSKRFDIAVQACREGWPAFETWPEDIQDQIREHVAEQNTDAA